MSGFYIGVDGKARKVKGGYIGVDGKARKIKKGYIGVNGVARLCWSGIDPVFANNSWEQIIAACQTRQIPDTWNVGDQKPMTIDGTDYSIDIIGGGHDEYSDGSGLAPLTFQLHEVYSSNYPMNGSAVNNTSWQSSAMRVTHLQSLLAKMPPEVQSAIKEVNKLTSKGNKSSEIIQTSDKLFLLSEIEIVGASNSSFYGEGGQYAYYRTNDKVKRLTQDRGGSTVAWWLRSPSRIDGGAFCAVNQSGDIAKYNANYTTVYVAPAFCF